MFQSLTFFLTVLLIPCFLIFNPSSALKVRKIVTKCNLKLIKNVSQIVDLCVIGRKEKHASWPRIVIRDYTANRVSQAIIFDLDAPECKPLTPPLRFVLFFVFPLFSFEHLDDIYIWLIDWLMFICDKGERVALQQIHVVDNTQFICSNRCKIRHRLYDSCSFQPTRFNHKPTYCKYSS